MDGALRHTFPAGVGSVPELAADLRMEAAAKELADMENPAPDFQVKLWLADGQTTFGIGELVTFQAESEADGYLTLVDLGTDGTVTVLFPNPYDRDNRVKAGERFVYPTPEMGADIEAQPPAGRGMVRAFLTAKPLDLPLGDDFISGDVLLADVIAAAVKKAAGEIREAPRAVSLDGWASSSVVYEVHQ
jgi:hypothetical protein